MDLRSQFPLTVCFFIATLWIVSEGLSDDPVLASNDGCPPLPPDGLSICVEECHAINKPCASGYKCCFNGCGHTCQRETNETRVHIDVCVYSLPTEGLTNSSSLEYANLLNAFSDALKDMDGYIDELDVAMNGAINGSGCVSVHIDYITNRPEIAVTVVGEIPRDGLVVNSTRYEASDKKCDCNQEPAQLPEALIIVSPCQNVRCGQDRVCIVNKDRNPECLCKPGTKTRGKNCVKYGPNDACSKCPKYSFCYKELSDGTAECLCIDGHHGDNCRLIDESRCGSPCRDKRACVLDDVVCPGRLPKEGPPCYTCALTDPCSVCPKHSFCALPKDGSKVTCSCIAGHSGYNCDRVDLSLCGPHCTKGHKCIVDTSACDVQIPRPGPPCYKCVHN